MTATVSEILNEYEDLQEVRVRRSDGGRGDLAYVQTSLIGPVEVDDDVIVNVTAVELSLGTGGWHFVHWNLSRNEFKSDSGGHAMKLRYTSLQHDVDTIEESKAALACPESLDGTPVVCAPLLSQAATAAIVAKARRPDLRIAMVISDQTALSIAISHVIRQLLSSSIIEGTITTGQAFGGNFEATTTSSGLLHAKSALEADLIIATQGPGSLGTASKYGFSILETARTIDDANHLGANTIFCVRWSSSDQRPRHRGLSHHSRTILERASARTTVPVPSGQPLIAIGSHRCVSVDVGDVGATLKAAGSSITSMGRSIEQDPSFFEYAAAAGAYGSQHIVKP